MAIKKKIVSLYLEYLQEGDIEKVISLFAIDGEVASPLYGTKSASEFYKELAKDTQSSDITFLNYFESSEDDSVAVQFQYVWTLRNGQKVTFSVIDVFEFDDTYKIEKLQIIYDSYITRSALENN